MTRAHVGIPVALTESPLFPPQSAQMPTLGSYGRGVTVTAHATPHSKGAWTEIIASTAADTTHLLVAIHGMNVSNTDTRGLVDIGTGAAASEVTKISELPAGFSSTSEAAGFQFLLPLRVPKGSRIAARLQALITVDVATVSVFCLSLDPVVRPSPSSLVTMNANTATSTASTFMTVSATYAEVVTATAQPFAGLIALPCGGATAGWSADTAETLTLAIGASGSEVVVAESAPVTWSNGEQILALGPQYAAAAQVSRHIPAGTRIACKITTGRAYKGVIILGIPY